MKYFKRERFVSWLYIGFAVLAMIICMVKSSSYDERSEELEQWYDANQEAANFSRFMRLQEPDRWKYWHEQWRSDPAMMLDLHFFGQPVYGQLIKSLDRDKIVEMSRDSSCRGQWSARDRRKLSALFLFF